MPVSVKQFISLLDRIIVVQNLDVDTSKKCKQRDELLRKRRYGVAFTLTLDLMIGGWMK